MSWPNTLTARSLFTPEINSLTRRAIGWLKASPDQTLPDGQQCRVVVDGKRNVMNGAGPIKPARYACIDLDVEIGLGVGAGELKAAVDGGADAFHADFFKTQDLGQNVGHVCGRLLSNRNPT